MGNEVLISSPHCGIYLSRSSANITAELVGTIYIPWFTERMTSYANYAQRCYSGSSESESAGRDSCTPFVQKKISSEIDRNASCPFAEKICRKKNGNIRIDVRQIDSQTDIGLNLPADLRFTLRKVTTCAPLESKNYQKISHYTKEKLYMQYFYGPRTDPISKLVAHPFTCQAEQQSAEEVAWRRFDAPYADYGIK